MKPSSPSSLRHLVRERQPIVRSLHSRGAATSALVASVVRAIHVDPSLVLGLATGATMEPVHAGLVAAFRAGDVSFANVTTFNLDEYVGVPPTHPQSYRGTMDRLLFQHVDVDRARTHVPEGRIAASADPCARYERLIVEAGGIDLQILGIGRNGHIGFNEPGSEPGSRTRVVDLHPITIEANRANFAEGTMPTRAVTMGVATILQARRILVLATGRGKRAAVEAALNGDESGDCPASYLRRHPSVEWFVDAEAAPHGSPRMDDDGG